MPSPDPLSSPVHGQLITAILNAIEQKQDLVLPPGTHLTDPHSSFKIAVPVTGLRILSGAKTPLLRPVITRPNDGIDGDDQYGLFFVPAPPTHDEIAAAQWKRVIERQRGSAKGDDFEYDVVVRGDILISEVDIDCNIQNQPPVPPHQSWEHSAMLAFSGMRYDVGTSSDKSPRRLYVAFRSVTINAMNSKNGGTADDIWISRGGFHPNIGQVTLNGIRSVSRQNTKRATIGFTELAARVVARDCDLFSLHVEDDVPWDILPRQTRDFQKGSMQLSATKCQFLELGPKGFVLDVDAQNLTVTDGFLANQTSGAVINSKINKGRDPRLFRLDMQFVDVAWTLPVLPGPPPVVPGIKPLAPRGEPCRVIFRNNSFTVGGDLSGSVSGQLISADVNPPLPNVTGDDVFISLQSCTFDPRAGSTAFPNLRIAHPVARGTWIFDTSDLHGLPLDKALLLQPDLKTLEDVRLLVF